MLAAVRMLTSSSPFVWVWFVFGSAQSAAAHEAPIQKPSPKKDTIECPVEQRDPKRPTAKSTPTPSLDGSSHSSSSSVNSRKRSGTGMKGSASALGLDKMIDEKRDAKSMSERVVHIEVSSSIYYVLLSGSAISRVNYSFSPHVSYQPNVYRFPLANRSKKFILAFMMDLYWVLVFQASSV